MIKVKLEQKILEKAAREGKRLTVDKVAEKSGVSRFTLQRLKSNPYHSTSTDVINKLCSYFECEVGDLLVFEEE